MVNKPSVKLANVAEDKAVVAGVTYSCDAFGIIHQHPPFAKFCYDREYVRSRYDTIPETVACMSHLRLGILLSHCSEGSLLDVGYGNGAFLSLAKRAGFACYGVDVSGYPAPDGVVTLDWLKDGLRIMAQDWEAVTFFDSLEHIHSLDFMLSIRARHVVITAPWCHEGPQGAWFREWKHRRPHEHLHHFRPYTLQRFMARCGYEMLWFGSPEDIIRLADDDLANTFTAVFRKERWT